MSNGKSFRRSIIIITIVFIIATVVTGAVVWKVTKDTYDNDSDADKVRVIEGAEVTSGGAEGGGGAGGGDGEETSVQGQPPSEEELKQKPWLALRLSRDVMPIHYDITMYPDFYDDGSLFYGNETIELNVTRTTKFILIHVHATYVNVTSTQLRDNVTGSELGLARTFYYGPNEFWVIETEAEIQAPRVVHLVLGFQGSLVKGIVGIYKSSYLNTETNEIRHISSSKFEPTYARRAFPCFDEPNIKAEYTITLVHRHNYTALSNMPQDGQPTPNADFPGLLSTKFERSVKMSTYLVCYIVCDFEYRETRSNSGKPVRVYAAPDRIDQVQFSLDLAKHTLDHYEDLFNMSYPLPKQDLIAIPDFVSGAMEHWGLISFRESRLLVDMSKSSPADIQAVSLTVAHEMAHMWFGNIVTMDWWNDLWLNEGFASYMEYLGVESAHPDWNIMERFLTNDLFPVMGQDSRLSSHPIIVDVERPSQITSVFDTISYSKGSSVIRMLNAIMGKESFFKGVSNYLKRFKWGNARTDDLWQSLSEAMADNTSSTSYDVKHIMDTWTIQDGFPYVNVSIVTSPTGETTVTATQQRFMSSPGATFDPASSPLGYKWYISLDYISSDGVTGTEIMDMDDITFHADLGLNQPDSWVKLNHQQMGYYRVLYPDTIWYNLSQHLIQNKPSDWKLSISDRAGLVSDAFSLAGAGFTSYEVPLTLISYLSQERHYVPWVTALKGGIDYIHEMLRLDPDFGLWRDFLGDLVRPAVLDLGFTDDVNQSHVIRTLRPRLMSTACMAEDKTTLDHVRTQFRAWLDQGQDITSVSLRTIIYSTGMTYFGNDTDWEHIWQKYLVEPSPQEKERLVGALAQARQPHLIMRLLESAKEGTDIRRQDFFTVIRKVGSNPSATAMLWDWTRENYQSFVDRFTTTDRYFGRMVYYMVTFFQSEIQLQEVKDLFARFPEAGAGKRYRQMALETIEKNIYWKEHFQPVVITWLKQRL